MKNLKLLVLILLFPAATFAQLDTIQWLETKGKIINIETRQRGRKSITKATVSYSTLNDTTVRQGKIDLVGLPFIGSFQSVGDDVKILYAKNQPLLIKSGQSDFIQKYGLYILLLLGAAFSLWRVKGIAGKRKENL